VSVRFGLLGTGYWATQTQGAALSAHPEVELVGVWGRDPDKAGALAQHYSTRPFTQVDDLMAEVDAVAIVLPPDVQARLAVRAAQAGRHLLLDKPLALAVDDADRVVEAVEQAGVASVVLFTQRFSHNVDAFVTSAAQRPWDGARITVFASIFEPGSPYAGSQWRREKGGLWDVGPHALSLALPVLGEVRDVVAMAGPNGASHVLLRHACGAVSTLALWLDAPPSAVYQEYVFYGVDGVLAVPTGESTAVDACGTALSQLISRIRSGSTTHPCDVRFARDVVAILARAEAACGVGN
jgi:predicted dehydrogenase